MTCWYFGHWAIFLASIAFQSFFWRFNTPPKSYSTWLVWLISWRREASRSLGWFFYPWLWPFTFYLFVLRFRNYCDLFSFKLWNVLFVVGRLGTAVLAVITFWSVFMRIYGCFLCWFRKKDLIDYIITDLSSLLYYIKFLGMECVRTRLPTLILPPETSTLLMFGMF